MSAAIVERNPPDREASARRHRPPEWDRRPHRRHRRFGDCCRYAPLQSSTRGHPYRPLL